MRASLAVPCAVYAIALSFAVIWFGVRGRPRPRVVSAGIVILEVGLVVQAVVVLIDRAGGIRPNEAGVHLAYTAVSGLLLPFAFGAVGRDTALWASTAVAVSLVAVVVVVMRMQTTWVQAAVLNA